MSESESNNEEEKKLNIIQFTIPCKFGEESAPITFYVGYPEHTHHPISHQAHWLSSARGGTVPQDLMDTLQKLLDLANENNADFPSLCKYALVAASKDSGSVSKGAKDVDISRYAKEFFASQEAEKQINSNKPEESNTQEQSKEDAKNIETTIAKPESAQATQVKQSDDDLLLADDSADASQPKKNISQSDADLLPEESQSNQAKTTGITQQSSDDDDLLQ